LSSLLWNLVVDELLADLNDQGLCAMGYSVRELSISPQKTVVIPFTNKRNIEGLGRLTLLGKQLQLKDGVKYLGVFLDSKLNPLAPELFFKFLHTLYLKCE
jgi:hypothetical protein